MTLREAIERSMATGCEFWRAHPMWAARKHRMFEPHEAPGPGVTGYVLMVNVDVIGVGRTGWQASPHVHWWHAIADDWQCSDKETT